MRRRAFLSVVGASAAAVAGCAGRDDGSPSASETGSPSTSGTGSPARTGTTRGRDRETENSSTVEIHETELRPGLVLRTTPDAYGVYDESERYLSVEASVAGEQPDPSAFALLVDGKRYRPLGDRPGGFRVPEMAAYAGSGPSELLFGIPRASRPEGIALQYRDGRTPLPDPVRRRIAAPEPEFSVDFSGDTGVKLDDDYTAEVAFGVTVENRGDIPGRFVAGVTRSGPQIVSVTEHLIDVPVDAGATERVTWTEGLSMPLGDGTDDYRGWADYSMAYPGGDAGHSVVVTAG